MTPAGRQSPAIQKGEHPLRPRSSRSPGDRQARVPAEHFGPAHRRAESDHSWRVGYLFEINQNGDVMYLSANGQLGATVDASGTVVAPANRPAGLDCYGKTLDELRSSGRTMESSAQSE
jgi:hypothetical protein